MISTVLIFSFLLHIIGLICIYQMFKQIQILRRRSDPDEMIDIFETYLAEIKAENRKLQAELVTDTPSEIIKKPKQAPQKIIRPQATPDQSHEQKSEPKLDIKPLIIDGQEEDDHYEASLQSRVLQQHALGLSANEIAKKLNCGKNEVALFIKMKEKQ